MSLWAKLFPPPSKDKFAQIFADALRTGGCEPRDFKYDPGEFTLSIVDGPQENRRRINLHNAYNEYSQASRRERRGVLERFTRALREAPRDISTERFDEVAPKLRPRIRDRSYYEQLGLARQIRDFGPAGVPHQKLSDRLGIEVVYDHTDSVGTILDHMLDAWGVSFPEALARARNNLWEHSNEDFIRTAEGVYIAPWEDDHDAARMFLHDLIWQLEVKGDHVVLAPSHNTLLVTGSANPDGLKQMAILGREQLQQARPVSGIPHRLQGDKWIEFVPGDSDAVCNELEHVRDEWLAGIYTEQKELLDKLHQSKGADIFVTNVMVVRKDDTGAQFTICVWTDGVEAYLARTSRISFTRDKLIGLWDWDRVVAAAGDLMTPLDMYPERWHVKAFPTQEQFDAMGPPAD